MALIPESIIEQVLAQTDILQTVQSYVSLKRSGSNHKGCCPFHDENTPSFFVHPGKGIFKCFGCGEGGNAIHFLMQMEGWNFPETVRYLAGQLGIEIEEETSEESDDARRRREGKKIYLKIMSAAQSFFEQTLWSEKGRAAQMYLQERGIDDDTARRFGMGYAPNEWDGVLNALQKQGISPAYLERAGLVVSRSSGSGHYDKFRHRIMFPVVDIWGNTLAFGGRILAMADNEPGPKYMNSPETTFYNKGNQLFGLNLAKKAIQKSDYALLVEGNFDVINLHAKGLDMAVAPMGTAVTEYQAKLLGRYAPRVIIAFDGDNAGEEATLRCLPVFERAGVECLVVRFDEFDDPDSFIRRHGPQGMHEKINHAQPLVAWALDRILTPALGGQIERKLQALEQAGELLGQIQNRVSWDFYAQEVSRKLAIEPNLLRDYLKRPQALAEKTKQAVIDTAKGVELESAEFGVLVVLLDQPQWLEDFFREQLEKLLLSQELAELLQLAFDMYRQSGQLNGALLLEKLDHQALRKTVENALTAASELYQPEKRLQWYQDCVHSLKRNWANRTLNYLLAQLEKIDFIAQREEYMALLKQKEQVDRFKAALNNDKM